MQSYLKLELSQIQQSSVQILGITGVCTGIAERSLVKCSVANQSPLALAGELQVIIIQPWLPSMCVKLAGLTPLRNQAQ